MWVFVEQPVGLLLISPDNTIVHTAERSRADKDVTTETEALYHNVMLRHLSLLWICVFMRKQERSRKILTNEWNTSPQERCSGLWWIMSLLRRVDLELSLTHTHTYLHTSIPKCSKCANITHQSSVCHHFREILLGFCSPTEILDWYILDREDERPCNEQETQEAVNPQCSGLGKLLTGTQK